MKALVCEMCNSSEMVKQEGMFVCQHCGVKYSTEEAKKLIIEGSVKVDSVGNVDNLLTLAENAQSSGNQKEAENYSNRILEIDPCHYYAWLIKGKSAGWQTTLAKIRFSESVECFAKAIENSPSDKLDNTKNVVSAEMSKLSEALLNLCCNHFIKFPSDDAAKSVMDNMMTVKKLALFLLGKCGVKFSEYENSAVETMRTSGVNTFNRVFTEYSNDNNGYPRDYAWDSFIKKGFSCVTVLKAAVLFAESCKSNEISIACYKDLIIITRCLVDSAAWDINYYDRYVTPTKWLNNEAKRANISNIMEYHQKLKDLDPNHQIPPTPLVTTPKGKTFILSAPPRVIIKPRSSTTINGFKPAYVHKGMSVSTFFSGFGLGIVSLLLLILIIIAADHKNLDYPITAVLPLVSGGILWGGIFGLLICSIKKDKGKDVKKQRIAAILIIVLSIISFPIIKIVNDFITSR